MPHIETCRDNNFFALIVVFDTTSSRIDKNEAQKFENDLLEGKSKSGMMAYVSFRMMICEKKKWASDRLTICFWEEAFNVPDDKVKMTNEDLRKRFWE